jgi:NAD(P)-dependent dehydrogenase (short-subunit alcohol dehydrogenase family)
MTSRFSLQGKHALVTGGTRGIGLAIAKGFLESGALVTICGRKEGGVENALESLSDYSEQVLGVASHVGKPQDVERLLGAATERFGPVGVLVNNAGTNPFAGPIIESEDWAWDKTMDVNLKAPYVLSREVAKGMIELGGGAIINMASVAGLTASPLQAIYSVSKAALIMLTKVMASELGRQGVRVNCICPGLIKTQLSEALWSNPELEKAITEQKALGRIGTADEIVGAAIYLASDASSFTSGAVLQVDGGMVI